MSQALSNLLATVIRRCRQWPRSFEFVVCLLIALIAVFGRPWPEADSIAYGAELCPTVALFNLWTFEWNVAASIEGYRGYWDAPIFHPHRYAFAFSEPQPFSVLLGPLFWITGSPALVYNGSIALSLTLNAVLTLRLLRRLRFRGFPAWGAAVLVELLPFVHWHLGTIQLVGLFGVLGTLDALLSFVATPNWRRSLLVGVWSAITFHCCNYYGLFLVYLLVSSGWLLVLPRLRSLRFWLLCGLTVIVAGLLVSPVVLMQFRCKALYRWERSHETVRDLSAEPADYLVSHAQRIPALSLTRFADSIREPHWHLGMGTITESLALIGLVYGFARRGRRLWTLFCLATVLMFFTTSLGFRWQVGSVEPYQWLVNWFPGFKEIRSPFRCAVIVQLAVTLLSASGLEALCDRRLRRLWPLRVVTGPCTRSKLTQALCVCLIMVAAYEIWPERSRLHGLRTDEQNSGWTDWVRLNSDPESSVAYLPFALGYNVTDFTSTTELMLLGLRHDRRAVNGYSGFFPKDAMPLTETMKSFPSPASLTELRSRKVSLCIVSRAWRTPQQIVPPNTQWRSGLGLGYSDEANGIDIYWLWDE